jgi:hypothetical protein
MGQLGRSGHPEDGADLVQHLLLPGADPFGAEAHEAALLAGVGGLDDPGDAPGSKR